MRTRSCSKTEQAPRGVRRECHNTYRASRRGATSVRRRDSRVRRGRLLRLLRANCAPPVLSAHLENRGMDPTVDAHLRADGCGPVRGDENIADDGRDGRPDRRRCGRPHANTVREDSCWPKGWFAKRDERGRDRERNRERCWDRTDSEGCTEGCTPRAFAASPAGPARLTKRFPLASYGRNGRYWARTSDPQLVELVLSQLS
jgi:hypothetical protein